tara:strand:+ start:2209 stop:2361 length:153 start_codon:yes stop_codon:yes gene_type:complete
LALWYLKKYYKRRSNMTKEEKILLAVSRFENNQITEEELLKIIKHNIKNN